MICPTMYMSVAGLLLSDDYSKPPLSGRAPFNVVKLPDKAIDPLVRYGKQPTVPLEASSFFLFNFLSPQENKTFTQVSLFPSAPL